MSNAPTHQAPVPKQPSLAEKLHELLASSGLTQEAFAAFVLGCDPVTLSRYLGGNPFTRVREQQLRRLVSVTSRDGQVVIVYKHQSTERWERRLKQRAFTAQLRDESPASVQSDPQRTAEPLAQRGPPMPEDGPVERLHHELGQFARSRRIREYVAAIRQAHPKGIEPKSEMGKWVTWMERHADNVNPIAALVDTPAPVVSTILEGAAAADTADDANVIDVDELPGFDAFEKMLDEELAGLEE